MSGRLLFGIAIIALGLLILLGFTPAGSWLRGSGSDPSRQAGSDLSPPGKSEARPTKGDRRNHPRKPSVERTSELLVSTIIEEFGLVDLTLSECVKTINRQIEKAGVNRHQLQIVLSERTPQEVRIPPRVKEERGNQSVSAVLTAVLRSLTTHDGVWIEVGEGTVELDLFSKPENPPSSDDPLRTKLHEIIAPVVDFDDTTIEEATDFLRSRSRELDNRTLDPKRKGILFDLQKPRTGGRGFDDDTGPLLTMKGMNIPIAAALDEIARQTDLRWKINGDVVVIYYPPGS